MMNFPSQQTTPSFEVAGLMDDFISIEEFAPGCDVEDVLAATWGVPSPSQAESIDRWAGCVSLVRRSMRAMSHALRSKNLEVA